MLRSAYPEAESLAPGRFGVPALTESKRASLPAAEAAMPRQRAIGAGCLATDVAMLATAAAVEALAPGAAGPASLGWVAGFTATALALFALKGTYGPRLSLRLLDDLPLAVAVTAVAAMTLISLRALLGGGHDAAAETARFWLLATGLLAAGRAGVLRAEAWARRRGEARLPTLIVGAGRIGRLTARRLLSRPELGLWPIGFLDREPLEADEDSLRLPVLGASWDLERVVAEHGVRHVVVTFSTAPHDVLLRLIRRCRELGVSVSVLPRLFEIESKHVSVERLGVLPLIGMRAVDPKGWQFKVKYALERFAASIALVLVLPLFALAAIAIRLTMGAPVLFRQKRVGTDGREFDILKLRTMKGSPDDDGEADIDWALHQLASNGAAAAVPSATTAPSQSPSASDRSTMLGRMLRRFSLDELPQLWNVVRGDMSLVGPRPERVTYVRRFEGSVYRYSDRHRVKSGITGWAQVNGLRGRTSLNDRVEWDNYYIENWSPWLDIKILLMTFACVLSGRHEEEAG